MNSESITWSNIEMEWKKNMKQCLNRIKETILVQALNEIIKTKLEITSNEVQEMNLVQPSNPIKK